MKLPQLLKDARRTAGLTQAELAERLGLAQATVSLRESASQDIPGSQLEAFVQATGTPIQLSPDGWQLGRPNERPLPFFGRIPCGRPLPIGEEPEQEIDLSHLTRGDWDWRNGFIIQATGESMEPLINDGDWLVCRRQTEWKLWDVVVVFIDEWTTVKQVRPHPDAFRGPCLAPYNESHGQVLEIDDGAIVTMYGVVQGRLAYQPLA